jgi:hypothetical protein
MITVQQPEADNDRRPAARNRQRSPDRLALDAHAADQGCLPRHWAPCWAKKGVDDA